MKTKNYYLVLSFFSCILIFDTSCAAFLEGWNTPIPTTCKENTELEVLFLKAIKEQNLSKLKICLDSGVNINGKSCTCKSVTTTKGQGMWGSTNICEEKPFFLEAISIGNSDVIKFFIDNDVTVNQSYYVFEWEKGFGGYHTGNVKSSLKVTTLDVLFNTAFDNNILELLLTKGAEVTPIVKIKAKQSDDKDVLDILKKHGIEIDK